MRNEFFRMKTREKKEEIMGKTIATLTAVLVITALFLGGCRQKKQEPPPEQTPPGGEEPVKEAA